jgi:hypothetical protein
MKKNHYKKRHSKEISMLKRTQKRATCYRSCCRRQPAHENKTPRQQQKHLSPPHPRIAQQPPSKTKQQESLGRIGSVPSTRTHHCSKAHMSDTENHAVRKPQRLPHKPQTVTKHMSGLNSDIINQSNSNQLALNMIGTILAGRVTSGSGIDNMMLRRDDIVICGRTPRQWSSRVSKAARSPRHTADSISAAASARSSCFCIISSLTTPPLG